MAKSKRQNIKARMARLLDERFCKQVNVHFKEEMLGLVSQGTIKAFNGFGNDKEEVMATLWFDKYWFFIRIRFKLDKNNHFMPYISISFFQKQGDNLKQLFRAEWDNYPQQDGYNHPQPHWHFTAPLSDVMSFQDIENEEDECIFSELVGNTKVINLDRMHFAMFGDWASNGNMINKAEDECILVEWMTQLFAHVKKELAYKDGKNDLIEVD
ncbi:MAG: hypothetical protein K5787_04575 [Lentisphaeria bacterium]|nr:hypothetical protein [Lentisphaeria bacterium]